MGKNEAINKDSLLVSRADMLKEKVFLDGKKKLDNLQTSIRSPTPESLVIDGSLDDKLFDNENELAVFGKWAEKFMFMKIVQEKGLDRKNNKTTCVKKNSDGKGPDKFSMTLPERLLSVKVSDIPYIIKQINVLTFGDDISAMPAWSSYKETAVYITTLISYLQDNGKTELVKKYTDMYKMYYPEVLNLPSVVDEKMKTEFQKKNNMSDKNMDKQIETDLASFFKKKLFESVFEGGSQMLYENMKSPDSEEHGSLLKYIEPFGKELEKVIQTEDKEKKIQAEKKLVEELYGQVAKYKNFVIDRHKYSFPADVVDTKNALCISKTLLIRGILEKYGIKNQVSVLDRHIYNVVQLSDGEKYVVDGTMETLTYDRNATKYNDDAKKKVLYESSDGAGGMSLDTLMMSEFLNTLTVITSVDKQDIMAWELANKLNPDNIRSLLPLGHVYEWILSDKEMKIAYDIYQKADGKLQEIIKNKESQYGPELYFKRMQIAILDRLVFLNKIYGYESDKLSLQKDKLSGLLQAQIKQIEDKIAKKEISGEDLIYEKNELKMFYNILGKIGQK